MTAAPGSRVLIVDDTPSSVALVRAQLELAGYRVATADCGQVGLQAAMEERPDLIILDIMMPGLDGYEVCRRLKANDATRAIPVVLLTALHERADKLQGLEAGADDFLTKPADRAELLARVRSLLRLKRLYDDLARSRDESAERAQQLAEETGRTEAVLRSMSDGLLTTDVEGRITRANPSAAQLLGWAETELLGRPIADVLPVSAQVGRGAFPDSYLGPHGPEAAGASSAAHAETVLARSDGTSFPVEYTLSPIAPAGQLLGSVVAFRDISERKQAEEERAGRIREQAARAEAEASARLLHARARQQAGVAEFGRSALAGGPRSHLLQEAADVVARTLEVEYVEVWELLPDGHTLLMQAGVGWKDSWVGRATIGTGSNTWAGYALSAREPVLVTDAESETRFGDRSLLDDFGLVSGLSAIIAGGERPFGGLAAHSTRRRAFSQDDLHFLQATANVIAAALERERAVEALAQQALHDPLTGLPNRFLLHDRLAQAMLAGQHEQQGLAVLIVDPEHFKEVNETLGHHWGDLLLRQIARRLQGALRTSDTVARLGGDEFAVVVPGANRETAPFAVANLMQALADPFLLGQERVAIRSSIGIALYPEHGDEADVLLRRAFVATQVAKRTGGASVVYAAEFDQYPPGRLALPGDLRQAIEQDQLLLHYQPKVSLQGGGPTGVEALVRWQHPQHGLVPPDQFISLAEQTGLIEPLSQWVLAAALRQCQAWKQTGLELPAAVNLSTRNLHNPRLPEVIAEQLQRLALQPHCLHVEVTESAVMADPVRAMEVLTRLRDMGVRLSIDDFGTGYSSLGYLKRLPVHQLKIDRSFVRDMVSEENDRAIVRATIDLSHTLGLTVVAEGVENAETLDVLTDLGCDEAQGYYLSRPLPADELARWATESPWACSGARSVLSPS